MRKKSWIATAACCALAPSAAAAHSQAPPVTWPTSTPGATARGKPRPNPCLKRRLHLRCPDLLMSAPAQFAFDTSTEPGHVLLRATSSIDNHGAGPLELDGRRSGQMMTVSQAIYDRAGRRHLFPTRARLVFKFVPGYRYGVPSVGDFSYWKLRYAAGFSLWTIDAHMRTVRRVRTGPKLDYCLRDLFRTRASSRSPGTAVYPACNQNPALGHDVLGTSVGWSDVYPTEYPEQWIDVTGLSGRFAYVQMFDPRRLLYQANPFNDVTETFIELPSGRVLGRRYAQAVP